MPTLNEFKSLVEAVLLGTPGSSIDRMKLLVNHLSVARLEAEGEAQSGVEVLVAFFVLGTIAENACNSQGVTFSPSGDVVLPWCRIDVRSACGQNAGGEAATGQGDAVLYRAFRDWWSVLDLPQELLAVVPWPPLPQGEFDHEEDARDPLKIEVLWGAGESRPKRSASIPWPGALCPATPTGSPPISLPARISGAATAESQSTASSAVELLLVPVRSLRVLQSPDVLLVVLLRRVHADEMRRGLVQRVHEPAVLRAARGHAGAGLSLVEASHRQLAETLQRLVSVATRTSLCPGLLCTSCTGALPETGVCDALGQTLCRLHGDLALQPIGAGHLATGPRSHDATIAPDEILFMRRDISIKPSDSTQQRVRYMWYPRQLDAMRERFERAAAGRPLDEVILDALKGLDHREELRRAALDLLAPKSSDVALEGAKFRDALRERAQGVSSGELWDRLADALRHSSFPLHMAVSNSTMDGSAFELVVKWTDETRVRSLAFSSTKHGQDNHEYYPPALFLAELVAFHPHFLSGVLFVPWVAPVMSGDKTGEYRAFGLAMVACGPTPSRPAIDTVRAVQTVRGYTNAVHTALLDQHQRPLLQSRPAGVANPSGSASREAELRASILHVLSLTGSMVPPQRAGKARPTEVFEGVGDPLVVAFRDESARPSDFHLKYAQMMAAATREGSRRVFRSIEQAFGHEAGKVAARNDSWVKVLLDQVELHSSRKTAAAWMVRAATDYMLLWMSLNDAIVFAERRRWDLNPWMEHKGGTPVATWANAITKLAWRVFVCKACRDLGPELVEPEHWTTIASGLQKTEDGATNLVAVSVDAEYDWFAEKPDFATVALVRWVTAALENAFAHAQPHTSRTEPGRAGFVGLIRAWSDWQDAVAPNGTRKPITWRLAGGDAAHGGTLIEVENDVVGETCSPTRERGTGQALAFTAESLRGELTHWGPRGDGGQRWLAQATIAPSVLYTEHCGAFYG